MEKQWQNCGSDGTSIESTYRQKTIESASETVYTVSRLGLVCLSVLRRTYASSSRIGQNNSCFYRKVSFGRDWNRRGLDEKVKDVEAIVAIYAL
jgi:hypothetical protein